MCFSPHLGVCEEGLPRGLGHNLLMQFYNLGSSRMVVPLPSLRCLAEGNRIFEGGAKEGVIHVGRAKIWYFSESTYPRAGV